MSLHHLHAMCDPNTSTERMLEIVAAERREQLKIAKAILLLGVALGVLLWALS